MSSQVVVVQGEAFVPMAVFDQAMKQTNETIEQVKEELASIKQLFAKEVVWPMWTHILILYL